MKPPRIETNRLLISRLSVLHSKSMFNYRSRPDVYKYQTWKPITEAEVAKFIEECNSRGFNVVNSWFQLGIYQRSSKELIGDIGFHFLLPDNQQTEIGFTIDPKYQRMGYAFECVQASIEYLFTVLKNHRVVASVDPQNAASIALLEKAGFRREGCFKQSVMIHGRWKDDMVYAILKKEFRKSSK
jgi:RimJ/RimL family protein N-acetyltransferase